MFYSQFILAKKGPLGTIWIAAHLERKLRKNQVADTDIGVSVDSIIFPEVPIALRLSSHLLLGVVRIYSKKVNYLFHDCSEALLKIKQAFRSTAVDLPPEESTAPYHSITLPETFHLDDFELPDSAFQGDFVDHHVSTKEQITLQDTLDGAGFSTMQFGLDERFGDGNASHIGLYLDEDLFLEKHASSQVDFLALPNDERVMHPGQSSSPFPGSAMDVDNNQNGSPETKAEDAEHFTEHCNEDDDDHNFTSVADSKRSYVSSNLQGGFDIRTPDLNLLFFENDNSDGPLGATEQNGAEAALEEIPLPECSHAPSTPGLLEETFSANMPESPALSPQHKPSASNIEAGIKSYNSGLQSECLDSATNNTSMEVMMGPHSLEAGNAESSSASIIFEEVAGVNVLAEKRNEQSNADAHQLQYVNSEPKDQHIDDGVNILTEKLNEQNNANPQQVEYVNSDLKDHDTCDGANKDAQQAEYVNSELKDHPIDDGTNKDDTFVFPALSQLGCLDSATDNALIGVARKSHSLEVENVEFSPAPVICERVPDTTILAENPNEQISDNVLLPEYVNSELKDPHIDDGGKKDETFVFPAVAQLNVNAVPAENVAFLENIPDVFMTQPGVTRQTTTAGKGPSVEVPYELLGNSSDMSKVTAEDALPRKSETPRTGFVQDIGNFNMFSGSLQQYGNQPSHLNVNAVPAENGALVENLPDVFMTQPGVTRQTTTVEKGPFIEVPYELLGKSSDMQKVPTEDALHRKSETPRTEFVQDFGNFNVFSGSLLQYGNQPNHLNVNAVPAENGALVDNTPDVFMTQSGFTRQTTTIEKGPFVQVPYELLGKSSDMSKVTTEDSLHRKSETPRTGFVPDVGNFNVFSGNLQQYGNQPNHLISFSSSALAEPEKMLFAPSGGINRANDLSQITAERAFIESDGSVNKITSLSGKKRRLMESASLLHDDSAKNLSRQRIRRNTDNVPNDDDLLASILVGKGTPLLRMAPTPPTTIPSSKHPRATKRKVLLDDASVLHADVIRQQLINTGDIRRIRKKAPCTRPEIWLIERNALGDEIFDESILTGVSTDLWYLHTRRYDSEIHQHNGFLRKFEISGGSKLVSTANVREKNDSSLTMPEKTDGRGQAEESMLANCQNRKDSGECIAQEHLMSVTELPRVDLSNHDLQSTMLTTDTKEPEKIAEVYVLSQGQMTSHDLIADKSQQTMANLIPNGGDAQFEENNAAFNADEGEPQHTFVDDDAFSSIQNEGACATTEPTTPLDILAATQSRNDDVMAPCADNHILEQEVAMPAIVPGAGLSACATTESTTPLDVLAPTQSRNDDVMTPFADNHLLEQEVAMPPIVPVAGLSPSIDNPLTAQEATLPVIVPVTSSSPSVDKPLTEQEAALPAIVPGTSSSPSVDKPLTEQEEAMPFIFPCTSSSPRIGGDECDGAFLTAVDHEGLDKRKDMFDVEFGAESLVQKDAHCEESHIPSDSFAERLEIAASSLAQPSSENGNFSSAVGEDTGFQEINMEGSAVVESPLDITGAKECADFDSAFDGNDTEFLNVDDEIDFDEEADYDDTTPQDARSLENSGWSSRTRGVARYLQTIFDEESGLGRKDVTVDRLIAGKTRKEASRMFFETLVLKTKDYIHVEQDNPFDSITIKPKARLLKSEF